MTVAELLIINTVLIKYEKYHSNNKKQPINCGGELFVHHYEIHVTAAALD